MAISDAAWRLRRGGFPGKASQEGFARRPSAGRPSAGRNKTQAGVPFRLGEALPGEALPGEALPGEALPGEALHGGARPDPLTRAPRDLSPRRGVRRLDEVPPEAFPPKARAISAANSVTYVTARERRMSGASGNQQAGRRTRESARRTAAVRARGIERCASI